MYQELEQIVKVLSQHVSDSESKARRIGGRPGTLEMQAGVYYCAVLSHARAFLDLLVSSRLDVSATILRAMLESTVNLLYVVRVDGGFENLAKSEHSLKTKRHGQAYYNSILREGTAHLKQQLDELAKPLQDADDELQRRQASEANVFLRFEKVGLAPLYQTAYWFLSSQAHGSPEAVVRNFLVERADGSFEIDLEKPPDRNSQITYALLASDLLAMAGQEMGKMFGTDLVPESKSQLEHLASLAGFDVGA